MWWRRCPCWLAGLLVGVWLLAGMLEVGAEPSESTPASRIVKMPTPEVREGRAKANSSRIVKAPAAAPATPAAAPATPAAAPATPAAAPATPAAVPATATPAAGLVLDVLLVNDPDFPPVTVEAAEVILDHARQTLADKLSFPEVAFRIKGTDSVAAFIERNSGGSCARHFEPLRVRLAERSAKLVDLKLVDQFLSRWSVESLAAFFPEKERKELTSYAAIRTKLLEEFDRKVQRIGSFALANGKSLLPPEKLDERSYVSWICAVRNQDEADLILTNAFILYDLASEPYPHSIFAKCKVGGASLLSPRRDAIYRRALVASTFSMVTDIPFFREEGVEELTPQDKLAVIGTFIVAHEMGHAVFKIPDFYDHPPECLMTTKFETGYVSGYRQLTAHPGPCPDCQPYVEAKRHVFLGQAARVEKRPEEVIRQLRLAIQKTPKHVDGSYLRYIADLSVQIAEAHAALGNDSQARRWLRATLRIVREHEHPQALQKSLGGR